MKWGYLPYLAKVILVAAAYFLAGKLGLWLAVDHSSVSLVWAPTGIALVSVLISGFEVWPGIALGAFLVHALTPVPLAAACGIALGNTLEALSGAFLLARVVDFRATLERVRDVLALVVCCVMLSTMVSATLGLVSLCLVGSASWAEFGRLWLQWWAGDAFGDLVVAPVLLTWVGWRPTGSLLSRQSAETVALVVSLIITVQTVFGRPLGQSLFNHSFWTFPFLTWAALRFGSRGAATATMLVSCIAILGTSQDLGPFVAHATTDSLLFLQVYMAVNAITGLLLAAVTTERQQVEKTLETAEEKYRGIFENAIEGIFQTTPDGRFLAANPALARMLGFHSPEELIADRTNLERQHFVRSYRRAEFRKLLESGNAVRDFEYEVYRKDGSKIWISECARAVRGANGQVLCYEGTVQDITARKEAEQALREYSERLQSISRQLLEAQETERRNLARELHDEIGQVLTAISINLQAVRSIVGPTALPRLQESITIVDQAIQQVREMSLDLRPSLLDDLGLEAALRWLAERQAQRAGFRANVVSFLSGKRLSPDIETVCFRVAQESLTNISRHAQATQVKIELQQQGGELELQVSDNGLGFDLTSMRQRARWGGCFGLLGMEERVQLLSGRLEIDSEPGKGTRIRALFPLTTEYTI